MITTKVSPVNDDHADEVKQVLAKANTGECAASKIKCTPPPEQLLVTGIELIGRGVDILQLGGTASGSNLDSLKAQVSKQALPCKLCAR